MLAFLLYNSIMWYLHIADIHVSYTGALHSVLWPGLVFAVCGIGLFIHLLVIPFCCGRRKRNYATQATTYRYHVSKPESVETWLATHIIIQANGDSHVPIKFVLFVLLLLLLKGTNETANYFRIWFLTAPAGANWPHLLQEMYWYILKLNLLL